MIFLIDHNLEGHALLLSGIILKQGWHDLFPIRFVTFEDISLPIDSSDRIVWQTSQSNQMLLLTANRSMKGEDSLEQTIREENTPSSLPVVTIGSCDRFLNESNYRERCVDRLIDILLYIDNYRGVGRIFIP